MSKQKDYLDKLNPENYYHIYNRANGKEGLFLSDRNRHHFLNTYSLYLSNFVETYTYCLLTNHFHFLVRVRSENYILKKTKPNYDKYLKKNNNSETIICDLLSEVFRRFFIAYSKAFNKEQNRHGNLFERPFKRILIDNDDYFSQLVYYIHSNPENHRIIGDFKKYKWSSYNSFLSEKLTRLQRDSVLDWFGGKEGFIKFHSMYQESKKLDKFMIEDKNDFFKKT
ncbi:MAG: hypothetical protein FVQ77_14895 [Cytophagales bacterium]|nr:hypothetical protein [Cytophagales bacterium]